MFPPRGVQTSEPPVFLFALLENISVHNKWYLLDCAVDHKQRLKLHLDDRTDGYVERGTRDLCPRAKEARNALYNKPRYPVVIFIHTYI